ncbi:MULTISPECIES: hypothetical protein [Rhizobium/Agrobacterium group]|uniref:DUF1963 domain-containing protein n=5 Tax=Rhizobium/Agrobacterium group TaxID=227290 RepID=A0A5B9T263_AGRTU|nr:MULTISPECIES: hypothetical protein [Rhizobium/Agrobacterium group]ACM30921.1 hypothetical protein Arad_14009 [Rhizobium rhizogenes K84]KJF70754.1 hypothetical protein RP75_25055 [Agrobacterium arsenijevicii]NTF52689.1 hypothetical protein [Rhizobium rhizogenes]NTF65708.1 hypothetical protein [Rhizobium rhizogenes]NTF97750.1 hypothetical protein [Rhizobium rhizogenes]
MAEIDLLLLDGTLTDGPSSETNFGGLPSTDSRFSWPACKSCGVNMQFLGQVRRGGAQRLHLIFMCQNDPGVCSEWEPDGGANAVVCTGIEDLKIADAPSEGEVVRAGLRYGACIERVQSLTYDKAREEWAQRHSRRQRDVLGQIGGKAVWLQGDETPSCHHCQKKMGFVAQLEAGPDYETEMNFGGGCGYLFECECAGGTGKFLWQN